MSTETTTIRVPVVLRNEIARLAEERSTTMIEVLTNAVAQLSRHDWWATIHASLDSWDDAETASYATETATLSPSLIDGL